MCFKFKDREEVANAVAGEGVGYFITSYCSSDAMPDEETRKAFIDAEKAIAKFESIIN